MEKPKSVTYGIRLLYISAILITVALLFLYAGSGSSVTDLFFMVILPASILFYFIRLLSKGKFWVRSVLLALTIINIVKLLLGFFVPSFGGQIILTLILLVILVRALFYLYTKEASAWYAHLLMEETTKKLANKKSP